MADAREAGSIKVLPTVIQARLGIDQLGGTTHWIFDGLQRNSSSGWSTRSQQGRRVVDVAYRGRLNS